MDIPGFIDLVPGYVLMWRLLGAVVSSGDQLPGYQMPHHHLPFIVHPFVSPLSHLEKRSVQSLLIQVVRRMK